MCEFESRSAHHPVLIYEHEIISAGLAEGRLFDKVFAALDEDLVVIDFDNTGD
ncbi:MAG TPA: hypothetical protein VKC66_19985 [Xanthobacteraceae bacterium]|nr:hypothetical protein [Xanthobacteraceae bacterium]